MHSLEIHYDAMGEPALIRILQVADLMNVPPKVAMKAWLQTQCERSRQIVSNQDRDSSFDEEKRTLSQDNLND